MRPVAGQERMIEGLNKQSADGADTELVALDAAALKAITEVQAERVVGGALRARPVPRSAEGFCAIILKGWEHCLRR